MSADRDSISRRIQSDVKRFRRAATGVRIPLSDRIRYWRAYIKLAQRGRMIHSQTHDAVYEDGPLKQRYERALEKINARLVAAPYPPKPVAVPTYEHGELEIPDLRRLMKANVPFLIRGGAEAIPARKWSLDYLEETAGACEVPINEAHDSPETDVTRPSKAHQYYDFRTGTLGEVVRAIRSGGHMRITTAEDVMHYADGQLRKDLALDYWEKVSGWDRFQSHFLWSRLFIGKVVGAQLMLQPENAFTLWHSEPGDNFFVLVKGEKTWSMAHPYYTPAMRPRVKTTTNYHGCNIDLRETDEVLRKRGFEGYLHAPKLRFDMAPGDVLRVPNNWWHSVVTHPGHYTIAATIRSGGLPNRVGLGYTLLRLKDRAYFEMAKSFAQEGRIYDRHIGFPRKPRSEAEAQAMPAEQSASGED